MSHAKGEREALTRSNQRLSENNKELQLTFDKLGVEVEALEKDKAALNLYIEKRQSVVAIAEGDLSKAIHERRKVTEESSKLQGENLTLQEETIKISDSLSDLKHEYTSMDKKWVENKAKAESELNHLLVVAKDTKKQIMDSQDEQKQVLEDIAKRTKAQDERERVLKMREMKVAEGERIVQQNASYLNL